MTSTAPAMNHREALRKALEDAATHAKALEANWRRQVQRRVPRKRGGDLGLPVGKLATVLDSRVLNPVRKCVELSPRRIAER